MSSNFWWNSSNPQISFFLLEFHTATWKIEITVNTYQTNFMKIFFKSTGNSLFATICIIFFGCMVWKKFIVKVCGFCLKYYDISIEIYQNLKFLAFLIFVEIPYYKLENRNFCRYVSKNFSESICQKYWKLSIGNDLFRIFWAHGLEKIHCWSVYSFFKIHQNLDWDPSKIQNFCFFVEIS